MTQHTPGPWIVKAQTALGRYCVQPQQPREGCTNIPPVAFTSHLSVPYDEEQANARLIAAAPEMLHFLKMFADETETSKSLKEMEYARALLAKIEGENT